MSNVKTRRRDQRKLGRLEIVSQLYKRGYSLTKIRAEVMQRLDLPTYSISTVHKDVKSLLAEWREARLEDIDDAMQLELSRIDDIVRELWEQWEKSKEDYIATRLTKRGTPARNGAGGNNISTTSVSEETRNKVGLGNPAYIAEIRQQLVERRKLLGLYAPEKKDIQGGMSFATFLMESGMIDDADER